MQQNLCGYSKRSSMVSVKFYFLCSLRVFDSFLESSWSCCVMVTASQSTPEQGKQLKYFSSRSVIYIYFFNFLYIFICHLHVFTLFILLQVQCLKKQFHIVYIRHNTLQVFTSLQTSISYGELGEEYFFQLVINRIFLSCI